MTWPFENDTSTIIKKLAKADLKEHKLKTLITAIITFFFKYVDTLTNELKENTFTVCGIIRDKTQEKGKQFYILTSDRFRTEYAQQYSTLSLTYSTQTATTVDVLVSLNSENADMSPDTQKDFLKSKGEAGGIEDFDIILNDRYIDGIYIDGAVAVGIIFFAIFIMFASSFVIYSIFYISIVNSMPMYAQFISLGTTKKQLRYFLKMQGNLLALRLLF